MADASETSAIRPDKGWSLRFRLLVTVIAALLPVAIVSILQGTSRAAHDVGEVHEHLLQTARAASTEEENMLAAAEQILRALSSIGDVREATADCNHDLSDALRGLTFFTNIVRSDAQGEVLCSALPSAAGKSVADRTYWKKAVNARGFIVSSVVVSQITDHPMLAAVLPLRDAQGKFQGALSIGVDGRWLDFLLKAKQLPPGGVVAIFDSSGQIIAANYPQTAAAIFGHAAAPQPNSNALQSIDVNGRTWSYATATLTGNGVFVGFAMPEATLLQPTYVNVSTDFLLPILMILLACGAIWFTTDQQVTRWIVYLRRISATYRSGHYSIRPMLENAPSEFQSLGGALADMAAAIQERDKSLREAIAQKTMLIREVHHRVKNNLQIVISLLNLQAQQFHDPAAQIALRQAQIRINALALVHRILYEIEDQTSISLKRLLRDLVEQVYEGMGAEHHNLRLDLDIADRRVSGEAAVPIALFTVEALTNIFKHAYPDPEQSGTIHVELVETDEDRDVLRLIIRDDGTGFDSATPSTGSRLLQIFTDRLGGKFARRSSRGNGTVVELDFSVKDAERTEI